MNRAIYTTGLCNHIYLLWSIFCLSGSDMDFFSFPCLYNVICDNCGLYVLSSIVVDTPVSVTPKTTAKDVGPRRSLNLQDYKKKRGLI